MMPGQQPHFGSTPGFNNMSQYPPAVIPEQQEPKQQFVPHRTPSAQY